MQARALALWAGLTMAAVTGLEAQENRLRLGFLGGITSATLSSSSTDPSDELDRRTGFMAGGFLGIPLGTGAVRLTPEILLVQKGAEQTEGGVTAEIKVSYIEIPVLLGVALGRADAPVRVVLYAGPALAFESGCTLSASSGGSSASVDCDDDEEISRKKTDFSGIGGARLEIKAGRGALLLGGRYTLGLTNLNDEPGETETAKNRTWGFYTGFAFPIGR